MPISQTQIKRPKAKVMSLAGDSWQFINVVEPQQGNDGRTRKLVRANAQRDYRRRLRAKSRRTIHDKNLTAISDSEHNVVSPVYGGVSQPLEICSQTQPIDTFREWAKERERFLLGIHAISSLETSQMSAREPLAEADDEKTAEAHPRVFKSNVSSNIHSSLVLSPANVSVACIVGSGNKDPFSSFPIEEHADVKHFELLWHCRSPCPICSLAKSLLSPIYHWPLFWNSKVASCLGKVCLPIVSSEHEDPLRTDWMPEIMTDPLLSQAITNYAAVHLDVLRGYQHQPETLGRKGQTMRMVNYRLESPDDAIKDSTICAVILLVAMEVSM